MNDKQPQTGPQNAPSRRRGEDLPTLEGVPVAARRKGTARCPVCGVPKGSPDRPCPRCNDTTVVGWVAAMRAGRRRNLVTDFFTGGWLCLRGFRFMCTHRKLWWYVALPIVINVVLFAGIVVGGGWLLHGPIQGIFAGEAWWQQALEWTAEIAALLAMLLVLFFLFTAVGALIAAPFNEALSEKVEQIVVGSTYEEPFGFRRDVVVPLGEALKLLLFQLVVMLVLMPLWMIPVVGAVPSIVAAVWFAALDFLDPVLERKRYTTRGKLRFMRSNRALCLGFGGVCYLMLMIPLLQLLVIPVGVVGGTLIYLGAPEK